MQRGQFDYAGNKKLNDGDINDVLYSAQDGYSLPADPGSSAGVMRQPMNRPDSASGLSNVKNANEKIAMLNKLKE